jgi:hypothetical protein
MRADALGFFWEDMPVVKPPKAEKAKRMPPERTWEDPSYLPGLEEALRFDVPQLTEYDLVTAPLDEELIFDVETYPNYFLVSFESLKTGKVMSFELSDWAPPLDRQKLKWVMENYCIVGFNSNSYDQCITTLAIEGHPVAILKAATDMLIRDEMRPADVLRKFRAKKLVTNHIDIIEVAPLRANLKIYGGRLHAPRMQDLPFPPDTVLTREQAAIVKYYNVNDLSNTLALRRALSPQIALRYELSNEYHLDLRSKSDAQIAEAVIADEIQKLNGSRPRQPEIEVGTSYHYQRPHFVNFQTELLRNMLQVVLQADFIVGEHGAVVMPKELSELEITIGQSTYRMGIGGLHSSEKQTAHRSDSNFTLRDRDATSFYPYIVLNQGLFPKHLGPNFLRVYRTLVERRIAAKAAGLKNISESLKITINGSFGKLGSKYSVLYAPDLLIQVTLTGQLSLLMLIEAMELNGIPVVSANTDGVVMKVPKTHEHIYEAVVKWWEKATDFLTEETVYSALYSRDVNNYIAVLTPDKNGVVTTKTKGAYANPWSDPSKIEPRLHKNPTNQICVEAIEKLLTVGTPLRQTIYSEKDFTKFVSIRTVKGGAARVFYPEYNPKATTEQMENFVRSLGASQVSDHMWSMGDGELGVITLQAAYKALSVPKTIEYLGKSIRWYYATGQDDIFTVYASNGNMVPKSQGSKPCLDLPDKFPSDVDYEFYVAEAEEMLGKLGY